MLRLRGERTGRGSGEAAGGGNDSAVNASAAELQVALADRGCNGQESRYFKFKIRRFAHQNRGLCGFGDEMNLG